MIQIRVSMRPPSLHRVDTTAGGAEYFVFNGYEIKFDLS
jgi:hypothetical protein